MSAFCICVLDLLCHPRNCLTWHNDAVMISRIFMVELVSLRLLSLFLCVCGFFFSSFFVDFAFSCDPMNNESMPQSLVSLENERQINDMMVLFVLRKCLGGNQHHDCTSCDGISTPGWTDSSRREIFSLWDLCTSQLFIHRSFHLSSGCSLSSRLRHVVPSHSSNVDVSHDE